MAGWRYRFPARSPLPGMMPPSGSAPRHARPRRAAEGSHRASYTAKTRVHMSVEGLVPALAAGKVVLLHGAWQKRLSDPRDRHLALLGGMPHTMLLAGYEPAADNWSLLNPAEPWLARRDTPYHPHLFRMNTPQLMDFWGAIPFLPAALRATISHKPSCRGKRSWQTRLLVREGNL